MNKNRIDNILRTFNLSYAQRKEIMDIIENEIKSNISIDVSDIPYIEENGDIKDVIFTINTVLYKLKH